MLVVREEDMLAALMEDIIMKPYVFCVIHVFRSNILWCHSLFILFIRVHHLKKIVVEHAFYFYFQNDH